LLKDIFWCFSSTREPHLGASVFPVAGYLPCPNCFVFSPFQSCFPQIFPHSCGTSYFSRTPGTIGASSYLELLLLRPPIELCAGLKQALSNIILVLSFAVGMRPFSNRRKVTTPKVGFVFARFLSKGFFHKLHTRGHLSFFQNSPTTLK